MATYNKFNQAVKDWIDGVHDFDTHSFKSYLSNASVVATNSVKADVADITAQNGYTGPSTLTVTTSLATNIAKATVSSDVTITATGAVGPFRFVVVYNDTPTSPADPLWCYWDYGSAISLANTETFTEDFDQSGGLFTLQ